MEVHPHDTPKFALLLALLGTAGVGLGLMAPNLFWVGAIFCYLAAYLTISRYWLDLIGLWKRRKTSVSIEMLVVVFVVFFEFLTPTYLAAKRVLYVESLDYEVSLRCLSFGGPLPVDPESPIYVVGTIGPIPSPPFVPWPIRVISGYADDQTDDLRPKGAYSRSVERCTVFNRGTIPIDEVFIDTGFHWHDLSPTDSEVMLGEDASFEYRPFIVPSFDADGKEANFYIINFGPAGVTFTLPTKVQLHRAGSPKVETVKLQWLDRSRTKVLFPPRGMTTKYVPNLQPTIPKLREPLEKR